jgi:hypothetical protein
MKHQDARVSQSLLARDVPGLQVFAAVGASVLPNQ